MMVLPVSLQLDSVRACFGSHVAVDSLSLNVHRGEMVALIGPNGSGKSTTLAIAAGLLVPQSGSSIVDGISRAVDPVRYAHRVGFVPQDQALYEELTAIQNLEFFGKLYGLRGFALDSRISRALGRARLTERADQRVATFSGGMKQRLGIALSLLHDPVLLLLDEPTASLDTASRELLFADLHRLRDDGHAILLTTHHREEAENYCDRVAILECGKLATVGSANDPPRGKATGRLVLYGHLRETVPKFVERRVRNRLLPGVEFEIVGRRVRIAAHSSDELGRSLAAILSEGVPMDTFRTSSAKSEARSAAA